MIRNSVVVNKTSGGDAQKAVTFQRERPHLLSVAFRILGSESDAEDVVQDTWIKFSLADTDAVRNISAWLTTVATRVCLDMLRRRREISLEAELSQDMRDEPQEAALLAEELTAAFVVVLDELTPAQRVALVLHDAFGATFEEIARILGINSVSAKKLASRARGRVRRSIPGSPEHPTESAANRGGISASRSRG